ESEVIASKTNYKSKPKPKKVVKSSGVGENVVVEEEGGDEGDKTKEEEELQVRGRRRLRKAASALVPAAVESEETLFDVPKVASDSDMEKEQQQKKRRQKQAARTRQVAKRARTDKEKIPLVEAESETAKEADVGGSGSPTLEQLDHQVDELLGRPFVSKAMAEEWEDNRDHGGQRDEEEMAQMDEAEGRRKEGRRDVGTSSSERVERSLFAPRRLRLPSTSTVKRS
ncbi:hypothetical protein Dimus_026921, partial [Dionaea muscipula]